MKIEIKSVHPSVHSPKDQSSWEAKLADGNSPTWSFKYFELSLPG